MSRANVSSRVEDIKKRLEAASNAPLLSPEKLLLASANRQKNESAAGTNIPATFPTSHSGVARRKSPNMASTTMTQHHEAGKRKSLSPARTTPVKLDRQLSSPGSRGNNVRRSPAFRCDKMVKGRNVVGQRPRSFVDTSLNRDEVKIKRLNSSPTKKPVKLLDSPRKIETKGVFKPEITYPKPKPSISPPKALNDIPRNPKIEYAVVNKALKTKKHVSDIRNVFLSENKSEETDINSEKLKKPSTKEDFRNPSKFATPSTDNANINGVYCDKMSVYEVNENYPEAEEFIDNKYGKIANSTTVDEPSGHEYGKISTTRKPTVKASPNEYCKVSLSNTLRAVLSSPLPAGPPPRKPPRTFAHGAASHQSAVRDRVQKFNNVAITSQQTVPKLSPKPYIPGKTANLNQVANILRPSNSSNVGISQTAQVGLTKSPPQRPTRSKTESEIMLRKLENVLKNHQKTGVVIHPTTSPPAPSAKTSQLEIRPRHQIPDTSQNETRVGWLESFSCINRPETISYQKLNENNSEFFVALPTEEHRNNSNIRRSSSVEHIYAIPFEFSGKSPDERSALSLEARRKTPPRKILAVTPEKIVEIGQFRGKMEEGDSRVDDGGLHYLSSPVSSEMNTPQALTGALPGASPGEQEKSKALRPKPGLLRLAGLVRGAEKPNQEKIQQIMNQAFGIPHGPEVSGSDESPSSTPDESLDFASSIAEPVEEAKTNSGTESLTDNAELRQLTERRKTYVRRVSCRIAPTKQPHMFPHLFQYVLLVGLNLGCGINKPYIKRKYPSDAEVTPHIEEFCFPDASAWPRKAHSNGTPDEQSYSLVITNDKGDRTFGYCRRVMPEGADVCLPLAYCIISPFRATGFYYKVLSELESRHGQPEVLQTSFIMELYNCSLPGPGQSLKPNADLGLTSPVANTIRSTLDSAHMVLTANFAMNGANGESKMENGASSEGGGNRGRLVHSSTIVRRPLDLRLEEQDLTQLFSAVSVSDLLLLFGSLLLERKVVLFSESLSKLSSCVEALQSILYPFSWQHTFIPVLPISQIEYCDAPTPYIFGILKQAGQVPEVEITDGIAVDVDTSRVLISVGDEATILPTRLRRSLKTALQLVGQLTQPTEAARNVLVSEAFVRAFVEVCGHYQAHIIARPEGRHFEREAFVAAGTCRAERSFLEWFSETAMFRRFLEVRMERGNRFRGVFEQRARERKDEIEKNVVLGRPNKKHRTLGDRFKEWTPFT